MQRRMMMLVFVALTAISLLIPTIASAASLDEGVILDEGQRSARGRFLFQRGCIETYIRLSIDHLQQEWLDGSTLDDNYSDLSIDQYNTCTEEAVILVDYAGPDISGKANGNLTGASLTGRTTAPNIIGEGAPVKISVNAYWVPAGRMNSVEEVSEIMATLPTGEEVPAIQYFTELDRRAVALGVVTINGQMFPLFATGEHAELYGFDSVWAVAPAAD